MLEEKIRELFKKNKGSFACSTLRSSNTVIFKVTEDGEGFVCDKGPAVYPFNKMDALEKEIKLIAKVDKQGKVYYGASAARTSVRLGDDPWIENTINGIAARRIFGKNDGDTVYDAATYLAAIMHAVGFARMHAKDDTDAYITLTGRF